MLPPKQATSAAGRRSLTAQNAAGALANLTINNLANRAEALHAQAVPPLVSLLRADCGGAADAARALHNICFQDGRLKSDAPAPRTNAADLLASLPEDEQAA